MNPSIIIFTNCKQLFFFFEFERWLGLAGELAGELLGELLGKPLGKPLGGLDPRMF